MNSDPPEGYVCDHQQWIGRIGEPPFKPGRSHIRFCGKEAPGGGVEAVVFPNFARSLVLSLVIGLAGVAVADERGAPQSPRNAEPLSLTESPPVPYVPTPADFDIRSTSTTVLTHPPIPESVPAAPANIRDIPVPEPGTLALIAVGAVVFGVRWKRRAA